MVFVDLIIPVPVPNLFTYLVPEEEESSVEVGKRVVARFGRSKLYTAVIHTIHSNPPTEYQAKSIEFVLDDFPIVTHQQLKLWDWMRSYYMCAPGEIMNAALPSGFKLISETRVVLNEDYRELVAELTDNEYLVAEALQIQPVLSLEEISNVLGVKNIHPTIKSLLEKEIIVLEEEVKEKYRPKVDTFVRINGERYANQNSALDAFSLLKNSPKQEDLFMYILNIAGENFSKFKIKRSKLLKEAEIGASALNGLEKKGVVILQEEGVGRLSDYVGEILESPVLSDEQETAYRSITDSFVEKDVTLLHGVTGSGKTEVYIKLIEDYISEGKQVLYLLPEIALTTQIVVRLQKIFGDQVGVYHSRYNLNERVEVWNNLLLGDKSKYKIILGARSSLFLPFTNLGFVIVDEEHENTFKQFDPAPRYHGRDLSIVLAKFANAKVVLGSATPSVESYFNAKSGKYGFVELKGRYGGVQLPEVQCGDIKEEKKKKEMISIFTPILKTNIEEALERKEQIILFQNRRGFAPMLECYSCGHIQQCKRCDVSLTYHKYSNLLRCHYCGYVEQVQVACVACGSTETDLRGFGTEKIEEEVKSVFPGAKVGRMDLDTTRGKSGYQKIISDFEDREIDVLVGTQMLSKGLDFANVSLVGILNADQMLFYPDFRAFERAYQLMAQVSGRAGRKAKRGKVIIQSHNPHHSTIRQVMDNDYMGMYNTEILNRRNFHYPPFYRLISLTFRHKDRNLLDACCEGFAMNIRASIGEERVLGPEYPGIARINNYYNKKLLIKVEKETSITSIKKNIQHWMNVFQKDASFKSVRVIVDVDPQ